MHVLVIGTGGREAAIRAACERHAHRVTVASTFVAELHASVDLVIVGPESALVDGVADRCTELGIACFGPHAALARLESSKGFTRALTAELGIPSPRYFRADNHHDAIAWWRDFGRSVVVKLDGLAAGKGVIVPESPAETDEAIRFLAAQGPIVLEERLSGPECSLIALCDGTTARALPIAQDHKRIGEGDAGANTGGMGAYAPAPIAHDSDELTKIFIQPVIDHFAARGTPYIGVLYAGLILTADGPRLLEFNCRFGDPEAQAILPLLESDLAELALACCENRLAATSIQIGSGAACTVVAAARGYPNSPELGAIITGLDGTFTDAVVFPAGVDLDEGGMAVVSGGRVLAVTGLGSDLASARAAAYSAMSTIRFDGMQVRRDIGWRAAGAQLNSYAAAGVDIDEGARAVEGMKAAVERTHGPSVLAGLGSFGGAFSGAAIKAMDHPVLVASTDGVGTKVELAARLGKYRGVGADIVNHCINDVLVQGARPLFFLDYIASSHIDAGMVAEVVTGMAEACEVSGCALLGGETAEMPGVYAPGAFDIAGTLVGAVDRADLLPTPDVAPGDVLIGVASNGPHTNGYSLLRHVFQWLPMESTPAGFDCTLGEALLRSHRNYLPVLDSALATGRVKALAHITGGGLPENLPRVLPDGCDAEVQLGSWPVPPLFELVRSACTAMDDRELYRTVNMGIGMVVICAKADAGVVQASIAERTWLIGSLIPGLPRTHDT
ncbi:MAG: phosphoribosylamine--glycine ligase/phosphoribosylformylglycinamidine cyclo-ligase, partial [Actinomycetota bacterium]